MARLVGLKNSDFDASKFQQTFSRNSGKDMSIEGVMEGWQQLKIGIEQDRVVESLKSTPYFIRLKAL